MKYFLPNLTLLFIAFKLAGIIAWSWWWVLSPITIPCSIFAVSLLLCCLVAGVNEAIDVLSTQFTKKK